VSHRRFIRYVFGDVTNVAAYKHIFLSNIFFKVRWSVYDECIVINTRQKIVQVDINFVALIQIHFTVTVTVDSSSYLQ
jgi:hypothetical protein